MSKKKKQATEELVQTQVLNIEEVRRVAKYEKKLSKKPTAFCAIIGCFMILLGGALQGYISYNDLMLEQSKRQKDIAARKIETAKEEKIDTTETSKKEKDENVVKGNSTLSCTLSMQGNSDGTNFIARYTYEFNDSKLKKVKKELMMDGYNSQGLAVMSGQYAAHQTFSALGSTVPGYNIVSGPRGDVGFFVTSIADLNLVDASKLPEIFGANIYASIDYKLDTKLEQVKADSEAKNLICELKNGSMDQ